MSTSLDITGKVDAATVELFRTVSRVIDSLGMPYVVVGATARDLVLHYAHGAELERATQDVDFAIEVPDWEAFDTLRDELVKSGFSLTKAQHRLVSPGDVNVDIVPFGEVEDQTASIAWPPKGEVVMSVLGFQEACDKAEQVRIADSPELVIPVATPPGMVLLKLIAWADRARENRIKDALDLAYLLRSYEWIPAVRDALYSEAWMPVMETYGWNISLTAAHKLGLDAAAIVGEKTRLQIERLVMDELAGRSQDQLITEMCGTRGDAQYERNNRLLSAFWAGFGVS